MPEAEIEDDEQVDEADDELPPEETEEVDEAFADEYDDEEEMEVEIEMIQTKTPQTNVMTAAVGCSIRDSATMMSERDALGARGIVPRC